MKNQCTRTHAKTDHLQRSQNCKKKKKKLKLDEKKIFNVIILQEYEKLIMELKYALYVIIITVNGGELFSLFQVIDRWSC